MTTAAAPAGRKPVVVYERTSGGSGPAPSRKVSAATTRSAAQTAEELIVAEGPGSQARLYDLSSHLLGGKKFWHHKLLSKLDVHSAIMGGISYGSLISLGSKVKGIDEGDFAKVLGLSTRTLRRQAETPDKQMPADLASKAWLFAETLAKATEIFGGQDEAERWMSQPAMGLDGQRPIEMLQTVQGAELVGDFLTRLEYGVYT